MFPLRFWKTALSTGRGKWKTGGVVAALIIANEIRGLTVVAGLIWGWLA